MNEERLGGFVRDLGDAARSNPISAALIGMGAVWLFASHSRRGEEFIRRSGIDRLPDAVRDVWEGTSSNLRSEAASALETARGAADSVRDRGEQVVDKVTKAGKQLARTAVENAEDLPDRASSLLDDFRGNMTELFRSQPLAIGVVGLAIGAAIAASFSTTETEDAYLGETSDFVKDKASEFAGEKLESAAEIGKNVAAAVADEAREQGLTGDGLKAAASDLSNKASRVAEAAVGARARAATQAEQ